MLAAAPAVAEDTEVSQKVWESARDASTRLWNQATDEETWRKAQEDSEALWRKAKQQSQSAWDKAAETSQRAWESTKDVSKRGGEKAQSTVTGEPAQWGGAVTRRIGRAGRVGAPFAADQPGRPGPSRSPPL